MNRHRRPLEDQHKRDSVDLWRLVLLAAIIVLLDYLLGGP